MIAIIEKSRIFGELEVSGAKNSFFPAVGAGIALGAKKIKIKNVPHIDDVMTMLKILERLGCSYTIKNNTLIIEAEEIKPGEIPDEEFGKIRGSVVIFGAMLGRFGVAKIPMPGGCKIGKRPIDQHIKSARELGFYVVEENNKVTAYGKPKRGKIQFDIKTVTGTENAILMSLKSGAEIYNAAEEPEVQELIKYLKKYGVQIEKEKDKIIVEKMESTPDEVEFSLIPDRIEAGTWLIATAATGGELKIKNVIPEHVESVINVLKNAGAEIKVHDNEIEIKGKDSYFPVDITAEPYPGFPTDMQPQICVMLFKAKGKSIIQDKIFPERISHVMELRKMQGKIEVENGKIVVYPSKLVGTEITAHDLRSAASLVIAGLVSEKNPTILKNFEIIKRGYENFEKKLQSIGGKIKHLEVDEKESKDINTVFRSSEGKGKENNLTEISHLIQNATPNL